MVRHRADLQPVQPSADSAGCSDTEADNTPSRTTESDGCNAGTTVADGRLPMRTRERHTAVHEQVAQGQSISAISRTLRPDRKTVRRFARAEHVEELITSTRTSGSRVLRGFESYLRDRFAAGCTDAAVLAGEITERGYRGSAKTVRRFLHPLRTAQKLRPTPPAASEPFISNDSALQRLHEKCDISKHATVDNRSTVIVSDIERHSNIAAKKTYTAMSTPRVTVAASAFLLPVTGERAAPDESLGRGDHRNTAVLEAVSRTLNAQAASTRTAP